MAPYVIPFQRNNTRLGFRADFSIIPSRRDDLIQNFINSAIDAYQRTSFVAFRTEIRVYPLKNARNMINSDGEWIGFDRYLFEIYGGETSPLLKPIKIFVDDNRRQVWVKLKRRRLTAYRFLHSLPKAGEGDMSTPEGRKYCIDQQARWWSANQKTFRLLDLPAEVREIIYQHALETKNSILPFCSNKVRRRTWNSTGCLATQTPNTNLLKVNKQVYSEAMFILYKYCNFQAISKNILTRVLIRKSTFNNIRNLELKLSHYEFFCVFGCKLGTQRVEEWAPSFTASMLRYIYLEKLSISFYPPSTFTESLWLDEACQATIVCCIFEAMWPWIKGHRVTFTGYLKAWQKAIFEERCNAEYQAVQEWQSLRASRGQALGSLFEFDEYDESTEDQEEGGVMLDGGSVAGGQLRDRSSGFEGSMEKIKFVPPPCRCTPSCTLGDWKS